MVLQVLCVTCQTLPSAVSFFFFSLSPFFPFSTPVAHYRCDAILKTTLLPSLGPIALGYSCFAWALKLQKLCKKRKKSGVCLQGPIVLPLESKSTLSLLSFDKL